MVTADPLTLSLRFAAMGCTLAGLNKKASIKGNLFECTKYVVRYVVQRRRKKTASVAACV